MHERQPRNSLFAGDCVPADQSDEDISTAMQSLLERWIDQEADRCAEELYRCGSTTDLPAAEISILPEPALCSDINPTRHMATTVFLHYIPWTMQLHRYELTLTPINTAV